MSTKYKKKGRNDIMPVERGDHKKKSNNLGSG